MFLKNKSAKIVTAQREEETPRPKRLVIIMKS